MNSRKKLRRIKNAIKRRRTRVKVHAMMTQMMGLQIMKSHSVLKLKAYDYGLNCWVDRTEDVVP